MRKKCIAILMVLLCITSMIAVGCGKKTYEWPTSDLAKQIPKCEKGKITWLSDYDTQLTIRIEKLDEKDYQAYLQACKDMGFQIDAEENNMSILSDYSAYNKEGAHLSLSYMTESKDLTIYLDAPIEMGPLDWPTTGLGALLPVPTSKIGHIEYENEDSFFVYVGETNKTAYNAYVKKCMDAGFTVDYSKDEKFYRAENVDGISIDISYEGIEIMSVRISAPYDFETKETTTAPETTTTAPAETTQQNAVPGGSADLRKLADDYEACVDEYCAFMQQYNANPGDPQLLLQYATMMAKLAKYEAEVQSADVDNASWEDVQYFNEVVYRCNQKILEASY